MSSLKCARIMPYIQVSKFGPKVSKTRTVFEVVRVSAPVWSPLTTYKLIYLSLKTKATSAILNVRKDVPTKDRVKPNGHNVVQTITCQLSADVTLTPPRLINNCIFSCFTPICVITRKSPKCRKQQLAHEAGPRSSCRPRRRHTEGAAPVDPLLAVTTLAQLANHAADILVHNKPPDDKKQKSSSC